jgi:hypothetical protein
MGYIFPFIGCGVKGDPLPPESPPTIGRGKPNFKEASKEIRIPNNPIIEFDETEDESTDEMVEEEDEENEY